LSNWLRKKGEELQPGHMAQHIGLRHGPVRINVTFPSTADIERIVTHTLGRPPQRVRVIDNEQAATVYKSRSHTSGLLYLKSSVASAQVTLEVE